MEPGVIAGQNQAVTGDLIAMIDRIAGEQGVETHLVHSVIRAESNYNAAAVSPKGALGIMQLIPATARLSSAKPAGPCTKVPSSTPFQRLPRKLKARVSAASQARGA